MLEGKAVPDFRCRYVREMHQNQMTGCAAEMKVNDWQMNSWIWQVCDTEGRRGMADGRYDA